MDRRLASPLRQEAANQVHACGKTLLGRVLWRAKGTLPRTGQSRTRTTCRPLSSWSSLPFNAACREIKRQAVTAWGWQGPVAVFGRSFLWPARSRRYLSRAERRHRCLARRSAVNDIICVIEQRVAVDHRLAVYIARLPTPQGVADVLGGQSPLCLPRP